MILAHRKYQTPSGTFTIKIHAPYEDGADWFCDVQTEGIVGEKRIPVGGIDSLQALRLALSVADSIIESHPDATCNGMLGAF